MSPLDVASRGEVVRFMLKLGLDVNAAGALENTALNYSSSRKDVVNTLVEAGASIEARNNDVQTPLLHTLARERLEAAMALLSHGAD